MASYMDAVNGKHTDGREQGVEITTVQKLQKALASVNEAIEELYYIDGMEEYAERLNYVAVEIEEELTELESVEGEE
jgi:hypothetical protein